MEDDVAEPEARSIEDENFDRVFPPKIRKLSALHWTQVRVAAGAAQLLVTAPRTRVLAVCRGAARAWLVAAPRTGGPLTG